MMTGIFLVKIIRIFESGKFQDTTIGLIEMIVEFSNTFKQSSCNQFQLAIWLFPNTNFLDYIEYFEVDDYLIIEGTLSLKNLSFVETHNKDCEFSLKNVYIYLLTDEFV
jgi:hypothetical protein